MRLLIDGDGPLYKACFGAQHIWYNVLLKGEEEYGTVARFRYKKEAVRWINGEDDVYIIEPETELEDVDAAIHNVKSILGTMLSLTRTRDYTIYIGGQGNYRYTIDPEYKANRKPRPHHYDAVKRFLIEEEGAVVVDGMEVDDACSIEQYKDYRLVLEGAHPMGKPYTMIASIDKDLDMVPGWHYNWNKQLKYFITEEEGIKNFYLQLLTGDKQTDNIPGLKGVGSKTSIKMLKDCSTEKELYDVCMLAYTEKETPMDRMHMNAKLLWMSKNEPNDWRAPE